LWALRYVAVAALFLVVYLLILRPVKRQALAAFRELPAKLAQRVAPPPLPASAGAGPLEVTGPAIEGQRAAQLKRMLSEKVKAEPATASRLVESWVKEDRE